MNVKITLPTVRAVFYTLFLIILHIVLNLLVVDWGPEIGAQHVEINEEELLAMRGARAEVEPSLYVYTTVNIRRPLSIKLPLGSPSNSRWWML